MDEVLNIKVCYGIVKNDGFSNKTMDFMARLKYTMILNYF